MTAIASQLKPADVHCFLIPTLKSFLITNIIQINDQNLLDALKPLLSRSVFDRAMSIAHEIMSDSSNLNQSGDNEPSPSLGNRTWKFR